VRTNLLAYYSGLAPFRDLFSQGNPILTTISSDRVRGRFDSRDYL
jgi:hypothetical protein